MLDRHDWRGEHLIRCNPHQTATDPQPVATTRQPTKAEVQARRRKVRAMIEAGMTARQIGAAVGVDYSVIYKDAAALGLTLTSARKTSREHHGRA